jgi:acyl-lipid omega-6 desaturase (Delta-12 desaturase)
MTTAAENQGTPSIPSNWKQIVARYQTPSTRAAVWQILNTVIPYLGLWVLMYYTQKISWWLTLPLAILAGGFMVRIFIIFHDCGHGSFFRSARANHIVGTIAGLLCFTPYFHWRWEHAIHHSTSGDLDRRGTGDVWTLTVQEYLEASRWKKFSYRLARNPFILFLIAPMFLFLALERFASPRAGHKETLSVYGTNLGLLLIASLVSLAFGVKAYVLIQLTVMAVAGSAGVWLFYVQHQFEGVYWKRSDEWDYATAALQGSSFYKLPKILQWFSGNIGFHHIHHLSPRIPNYNLEKCHKSEPVFQTVPAVTLLKSFKSFTFRLWDEQRQRLIGYGDLRAIKAASKAKA